MPPVKSAQTAASCSCATLLTAYPLRGSSGADSVTGTGSRSYPQREHNGSNRPRTRSARARAGGRTALCSRQS